MSRQQRRRRRKTQLYVAILVLVVLLSILVHNQVLQDVFAPTISGAFYRVNTNRKVVAFTFDVVWTPAETRKILEILDRYHVRSTFFLTGTWLRKNSTLAREILAYGHEIGLHGYSQMYLTELDDTELSREFELMEEALREELNYSTFLFRPPYGELDQRVFDFTRKKGYTTVLWSINPHDWLEPGVDRIVGRVSRNIHKGAIILFHTSTVQTSEALPQIIQGLRLREYETVPVSELLEFSTQE